MSLPTDLIAFVITLLRGAQLAAQALLLGGIAFVLAVSDPLAAPLGEAGPRLCAAARRWTRRAALGVAGAALAAGSINVLDVVSTMDLSVMDALGAEFVQWSAVTVASALLVAFAGNRKIILAAGGATVLMASAMTSHAAARLDQRGIFLVADLLHQCGAAIWIGGIPFLLLGLRLVHQRDGRFILGRRCSQLYALAVGALAIGALVLAVGYTRSLTALTGTAYGAMMGGKLVLLATLLSFGLLNALSIRRLGRGGDAGLGRLRRLAEAEIGIGLTVMFVAASLASHPLAVDQVSDPTAVASLHEIAQRMAPAWPSLSSPPLGEISVPADASMTVNPTAADHAWSGFNHHWSALFVLLIGLLALAERTGRAAWARHWPALLIGLAVLLLARSDPETWPLGPIPFFDRLRDPEVLQHRLITLVVTLFGCFEWAVRCGRLNRTRAPLIFPLLCAVGGGLLLTHGHSLADVKQSFLIELSHIPMGLLGIYAGWSRWLELRGEGRVARVAGWIWPICFVLIGLLLLNYRES
jgi:copper resistance protein D